MRTPAQETLFHVPAIEPLGEVWYRHCQDCDVDVIAVGECYMVQDAVWPLAEDGGVLCVGCLEARIGRELTREDFTACLVNLQAGSPRLRSRLAGG